MHLILTGILAGIAAAPASIATNLLVDFLFRPVVLRHAGDLNQKMLARPALNLVILVVDLVFWGAVFGAAYGLLYPGLERFGIWGGALWGSLMFISFSRSTVEGSLWTKVPRDINLFWAVEGLAGMLTWGTAFGFLFASFVM